MSTSIFKIRHIPSGKFIRIRLEQEGINVWAEKDVINTGIYGKVLYDTHKGWATRPNPDDAEFARLQCEIVEYNISIIQK